MVGQLVFFLPDRTTITVKSPLADESVTDGSSTYLVNPQDAGIQSRALILFKEIKIHVQDVGCLERLHHSQQYVDVAGPFANYVGYHSMGNHKD